ncbi:MAG TPA: NAD(P)-dependent oxidoreductase [Rubrivivax sp.]|nr:phosphoglycerate dehydrogenase [Burkholderiales bacterium]HNT38412.1 NAD(P)-dependent oxidoreductase [Rubrivivax sp.]
MDLLVVEPLDPEVLDWLSMRHAVVYAPHLAHDAREFRAALAGVRGLVLPPSVALDRAVLRTAPQLRAVGRLSAGVENLDLEACAQAGVEVVRPSTASAAAEAEFAVGALLQLLRRVPVFNAEGLAVGRELGGAVIGIVGMTPAARTLARLLDAFGARVLGYDPAVHAGDALWDRWGVEPVPLRQLMEHSDGVCVLLTYFSRYHGLFGQRYLAECKPDQVLVSLAPSGLFDEQALAQVLRRRRMAAAWFDSMEPGTLDSGRPLHAVEALQVTPRVASTTRESRVRSAWAVAQRMDEILQLRAPPAADFTSTTPGAFAGLEDDPAPA